MDKQSNKELEHFIKHVSIPPEQALKSYLEHDWNILELKDYLATFNYREYKLHELLVKTSLAICKSKGLFPLHNFIREIYKDTYNLSEFDYLTIFEYEIPKGLKNVVNSYSTKFSGGIGDFLRGSIYLYDKLKDKGVNFYIDFRHHPMGKYIKTSCDLDYTPDNIVDLEIESDIHKNGLPWSLQLNSTLRNLINFCPDETVTLSSFFSDVLLVPNYQSNATVYLEKFSPSEACSSFFRDNIKFDTSIETLFNLGVKAKIPDDYEVIHFRLGDMQILSNLKEQMKSYSASIQQNSNYRDFNHSYETYYQIIVNHLKTIDCKNLILMSDCNEFKQYILEHNKDNHIHVLHTQSCHTSYAPSTLTFTDFQNADIQDEKLLYTALDIKILSQSKKNTSHSVYDWGSGFVYWISKIFNIPCSINKL